MKELTKSPTHDERSPFYALIDENAANNSTDITQTTITLSSSSSASSILSFDDQTTKIVMDILCIHLTILNNTGVCV